MKAPDFDYACPQALEEALALLDDSDRDVALLAGGQSLMPMLNFRLATPDLLIDLNGIDKLAGFVDQGDAIVIGAMTRYAELETSDLIAKHIPLLRHALPFIAHPAIRNRGTIGGSVALADPAAEMPALLLALDATIIVTSIKGERAIVADAFFLGLYETALRPGEMVKAISIPKTAGASRFAFDELARRHGDYAMVGVVATADDVDPFNGLRLAFFGIANRAIRAAKAEKVLDQHTPDDGDTLSRAMEAVSTLTFDGDLNASAKTKQHLAKVLLKRVLKVLSS